MASKVKAKDDLSLAKDATNPWTDRKQKKKKKANEEVLIEVSVPTKIIYNDKEKTVTISWRFREEIEGEERSNDWKSQAKKDEWKDKKKQLY